jgi:hypothetical protein
VSHTPGPWEVWEINDGDSRPEWRVVQVTGGRATPWVASVDGRGNARLIAAAPDLLAALERMRWLLERVEGTEMSAEAMRPVFGHLYSEARATIAKATGDEA